MGGRLLVCRGDRLYTLKVGVYSCIVVRVDICSLADFRIRERPLRVDTRSREVQKRHPYT